MGFIISGMASRPMQVGNHLRAIPGAFLLRFTRMPAPHVMRLITNPGIMTDANICHRNTSPAIFAADIIWWPPTIFGFYRIKTNKKMFQLFNNSFPFIRFCLLLIYLVCFHGLIDTVTDYISNGNSIAQMDHLFRNYWSQRLSNLICIP